MSDSSESTPATRPPRRFADTQSEPVPADNPSPDATTEPTADDLIAGGDPAPAMPDEAAHVSHDERTDEEILSLFEQSDSGGLVRYDCREPHPTDPTRVCPFDALGEIGAKRAIDHWRAVHAPPPPPRAVHINPETGNSAPF